MEMAPFVWLSLLLMFLGDPVDSDAMDRRIESCMNRMKKNPMMERRFTGEMMRGICRNQMKWATKVSGMSRADQSDRMNSMSPGVRNFLSSLGARQGQSGVSKGLAQDALQSRQKAQEMEEGKVMCMNRMKRNNNMMKMFTSEQMGAVCNNQMTWSMKVAEAKRQDPTMRTKMDSMSQPVKDYYNSLETENKRRRSTRSTARPRKEYRMLTAKERQSFHDAINAMKNKMVDGNINEYDAMVLLHRADVSPGAHGGVAFLGWHREYLIRMERALQKHDSSVMLPYWDSTLDNNLGDLANKSIMWSEEFMGNGNGQVVTGPFANWETPQVTYGRDGLWRAAGEWANGSLYSEESVTDMISIDDFRENTWHVNQFVESDHGLPHLWVGGPMGTIEGSPSDPIFFAHHSFIDLLWELQEQRVYSEGKHDRYVYPPEEDHEAYGVGQHDTVSEMIIQNPRDSFHFITNPMLPFEHLINADGHRETYRLLYNYAPRPSCSRQNSTCGSPYLFCIDEVYKCAPKLQLGANCKEFESSDCCYEGICEGGVCKSIPKCN